MARQEARVSMAVPGSESEIRAATLEKRLSAEFRA